MSIDTDVRPGLAGVLADHGVTEARLIAETDNPFGEPLLISASGSQVLGYHTDRQFLQLDVIVEAEDLTDFAVASYIDDLRIETIYFGSLDVLGRIAALRDEPWPRPDRVDRNAWLRRELQLNTLQRFRLGTTVRSGQIWADHVATLRDDWLPELVADWWRTEARRRWLAARWLTGAVRAHRYCDAVLQAIEAELTARDQLSLAGGHFSLGPCWQVDRLAAWRPASGADQKELLRTALRVPRSDIDDYVAWCERLLTELLGPLEDSGLRAELRYSAGVTVRPFGNHTVVSRWAMRASEYPADTEIPEDDADVVWQGPVGQAPPATVLDLFRKEMLWLGLMR